MKILILGGTKFLGRYVVEGARARGHEVTLFNRGQLNAELFPEVEKLRGDRDGGLDALKGRRWDAVVDTSGYSPRVVRDSARLLADAAEHYTFVSSQSVYKDTSVPGVAEDYPVGTITDEQLREAEALQQSELTTAPFFGERYGPLKALCERAAEEEMPGRVLHVRAGLIVGPHDYSDRFTYWPRRVAEGGEVLAPGDPERQVQFIDARDLAGWILDVAEARKTGTFNATGPDYKLTMGRVLDVCRGATGSDARFVWVDEQFLLDAEVGPWMEMPLWVEQAGDDNVNRHFMEVSTEKAVAAGLKFRPLSETVRDTLEWDLSRPADTQRRAGLASEKERQVLDAWRERGGA
ncbi:MAG TPA: NAD-dependent epimerase/dehydratase family protein [Pyrinomonadaceae bacterium]